jgi:putative Ca2+/H+ antiporter (TMEM165/GDT1 family)
MNVWPFIVSFLVIAGAELGDKTQLLTLGFATRYPIYKVLSAISLAIALLMGMAVFLGKAISLYVPEFYVQFLSALIFLFFGFWMLFSQDSDEGKVSRKPASFWLIFGSFFLAELGDKTQLATFALSAKYNQPLQVWLGATLGMVAVNILAAMLGGWIKNRQSKNLVKWVGALVFMVFGLSILASLYLKR